MNFVKYTETSFRAYLVLRKFQINKVSQTFSENVLTSLRNTSIFFFTAALSRLCIEGVFKYDYCPLKNVMAVCYYVKTNNLPLQIVLNSR